MGLFSKNKLTFDQLADGLASMVFETGSVISLKAYKTILKDMGENEEIDSKQKNEIMVFEMFAAMRAVSKIFSNLDEMEKLLDIFHEKICRMVSASKDEQISFKQLVKERYQTYHRILSSKEENVMFIFGKQFANNLLNKEVGGTSLVLILSSAQLFVSNYENLTNFMTELLSKFELKN